jgi:hypothetical protein
VKRVTDEARVAIHRHAVWQPIALHRRGHCFKCRRHCEVRTWLRIQQDRCAGIDCIEHFDQVLLLSIWLRRNSARVFKIDLPTREWLSTRKRSTGTDRVELDALILTQDLPDGTRGARQPLAG